MQCGYHLFLLLFLDTLLIGGYSTATDHSDLLSFLPGEFAHERLVRVLALDPFDPNTFYLVGIN